MNTKAEVVTFWGDQNYLFSLKAPQIDELERLCGDVGISVITQRVIMQQCSRKEMVETIRLGLIGGGTDPKRAFELVQTYAVPPFAQANSESSTHSVASKILGAVWYGLSEINEGESEEGEDRPGKPGEGASISQPIEPASSPTA